MVWLEEQELMEGREAMSTDSPFQKLAGAAKGHRGAGWIKGMTE